MCGKILGYCLEHIRSGPMSPELTVLEGSRGLSKRIYDGYRWYEFFRFKYTSQVPLRVQVVTGM